MLNRNKLTGLIAAPFATLDKSGHVNYEVVPDYYKLLERNGVMGAFINGTTGEGPSLTQKEKHRNAEKWAECSRSGGKVRIISMIGGTCLAECIENAIHSKESGIKDIAVIGPYFFRPPDEGHLAEFVASIGESVPGLNIYYYHIPVITGVNIRMISFLNRIDGMLPGFAGIKFTHEDLMDFFASCNFENGKYQLLWGRDECMLAALALGATGFVGSTYNYAAPLYHKLIRAFNDKDMDEARRLQLLSVKMITLLGKYGGTGTGKAFMKYIGLDCGSFRLPVRNLTDAEFTMFSRDVRELGMEGLFSAA